MTYPDPRTGPGSAATLEKFSGAEPCLCLQPQANIRPKPETRPSSYPVADNAP